MDHSQPGGDGNEALATMEDVVLDSAEADLGQKNWIRPGHWTGCVGGVTCAMKTMTRKRILQSAGDAGQKDVREKSGRSV